MPKLSLRPQVVYGGTDTRYQKSVSLIFSFYFLHSQLFPLLIAKHTWHPRTHLLSLPIEFNFLREIERNLEKCDFFKRNIWWKQFAVKIKFQKTSSGCNILIGTPGRLEDFVAKDWIGLEECQFFILDEADRMLDMGFEPSMRKLAGDHVSLKLLET